MKVRTELRPDHLERLAARKSPLQAISELIWNAVDGDATEVHVSLVENHLQGIEEIQVLDNGHGITHERALAAFGSLGASWKAGARSPKGRRLHGQAGEGRFSAFCLGRRVRWITQWHDGQGFRRIEIKGSTDEIGTFDVSDPVPADKPRTGTQVVISDIEKYPRSLAADEAVVRLAEVFALYLREHPEVRIVLNGAHVDPASVEVLVKDYPLPAFVVDGRPRTAQLTVIEWKHKVDRELLLCDDGGFALAGMKPGIQAAGFQFTAYLKSDFIRECSGEGVLELSEMQADLNRLVDAAKATLRDHFRARQAEQARSVVDEWKAERIYPYEGTPRDVVEETERQVFDVLALNINEYLPDFSTADLRSKKLSLHMLKTAIERSPAEARRIIEEVLVLPKEKQDELVELLGKTSLTSIINAAKLVVDRLDFLAGLEVILFDPVGKQKVRERKHLHRILADNTWIFGEEFHLTADDESLTTVLKRHLNLLGDDRQELAQVTTVDGEAGIVDLMLSRRVPQNREDEIEHLVIELKRPNKPVDQTVIAQIKKYANAVAHDERFRNTKARWIFWAVSNRLHDEILWEVKGQADRPDGMIVNKADDHPSVVIWVKDWGQIIEACRARLQFFQTKLNYMANQDSGLAYVQQMYRKYLPAELAGERPAGDEQVPVPDAPQGEA